MAWEVVKKGFREGRGLDFAAVRVNIREGKLGLSRLAQDLIRQGQFDHTVVFVDRDTNMLAFKGTTADDERGFSIGKEGQLSCKSLFSNYGLDKSLSGTYPIDGPDKDGMLVVDLNKEPIKPGR